MWELGGSLQSLWCLVRVELQLHWLSCWQDTPSRCWIESLSSSMSRDKMKGSNVTQWCIVNVCVSLADLEKPKIVHNDIIKSGIWIDVILESNLIHMYARCGNMKLARQLFIRWQSRTLFCGNAMFAGSVQNRNHKEVFEVFWQMQ
jgi:hypothetical protein